MLKCVTQKVLIETGPVKVLYLRPLLALIETFYGDKTRPRKVLKWNKPQ